MFLMERSYAAGLREELASLGCFAVVVGLKYLVVKMDRVRKEGANMKQTLTKMVTRVIWKSEPQRQRRKRRPLGPP
jgi:hypothetical protein